MVAIAERLPSALSMTGPCRGLGGAAHDLAGGYLRCMKEREPMTSISRRQVAAAGLALPLLIPRDRASPRPDAAPSWRRTSAPAANSRAPAPAPRFRNRRPASRRWIRCWPRSRPGRRRWNWSAQDTTVYVAKDVAYAGWTFGGTIPGRPIRVVEGDAVKVTVKNQAEMAHSLDTHAAQTPPDINYPIIMPGEEYNWGFSPKYPGAYMYHCGTPPVLMHIGAGMYGAMIVDPKEGWPPAQELVFVQSEFYLMDGEGGVKTPDFAKLMQYGALDYVVFNGYANQYVETPIPVRVGEPIRIFVVNAGPNVWSSFHVVGAIFDAAYVNANPAQQAGRAAVDHHRAGGRRLRRVHAGGAGDVRRGQPRLRPRPARRDRPAAGGVGRVTLRSKQRWTMRIGDASSITSKLNWMAPRSTTPWLRLKAGASWQPTTLAWSRQ